MRKQYHPLPSEKGLLVWDVDRLVELSRDFPVETVALEDIWELDRVRWFDETHPPTPRALLEHIRLIEEADLSYPIILGADGRVMDGMHRILRALLRGETRIQARRFTVDPEPDYVGVSLDDLPY